MNKIGNILWGIVLIALGLIFGLNALEITKIDIFFDGWWTLIIIVPSFIGIFKENEKTGSIIGLVIGVCLLLSCQEIIDFNTVWKLIIPFILVMIGLSIVFKDTINNKIKKEIKKLNKSNQKEYYATFGGQNLDFTNEKFDSCELNAIFGTIKCDLKEAKIEEDVAINAVSVFGGIGIHVPKNVNVKITSTPIFGGVSDERKNITKDAKVTIYINATCMFGGVEIK